MARNSGVKLRGIEACRGIAAVMVLLLHATHMLADPAHPGRIAFGGLFLFGRAGVDFFFVLSGFIIAYIHADDVGRPKGFGVFWRKRLLRIYPTYWAVTALYLALFFLSPTREGLERDPWHVFTSLLLIPDQYLYPIVSVAWSLRHELLFYALFSLLILDRRVGKAALAAWFAVIVFNMGWAMATGTPYFAGLWGDLVFRVFNVQFLFGIAVAVALRRAHAPSPGLLAAAGAAIFLANGMAESFLPEVMQEWPVRHLLYALGSAMLIYGLATRDLQGRSRVPAPLIELGAASYSLYLLHILAVLVLAEIAKRIRPFLDLGPEMTYILVVAVTVLCAVVFSRCIERPLMRAGNRLFVSERASDDQPGVTALQLDHDRLRGGASGDA